MLFNALMMSAKQNFLIFYIKRDKYAGNFIDGNEYLITESGAESYDSSIE